MHKSLPAEFIKLSKNALILDVRSPSEFAHAHIPGAKNLPLFSDEERKVVGTLYKQAGREEAIRCGLDFFGPKMRSMVEMTEALLKTAPDTEKPEIFIYCWRGGMRSAAVSWLLGLYGFRVRLLAGGYKAFRNLVLRSFELPYKFNILGGYTGSGKTGVLKELEKLGETVIDLEAIASHKGSAFGNIDMPPQPAPEMFENLLSMQLLEKSGILGSFDFKNEVQPGSPESGRPRAEKIIWMEDESQRIGDLNIPNALWNSMRNAPVYFLEIGFENRLDNICSEYGSLNRERLIHATQRISKRLGPLDTKNALAALENGELREAFTILLRYYDKHYLKGLHNRSELDNLLTILPCQDVSPENARLLQNQYQTL